MVSPAIRNSGTKRCGVALKRSCDADGAPCSPMNPAHGNGPTDSAMNRMFLIPRKVLPTQLLRPGLPTAIPAAQKIFGSRPSSRVPLVQNSSIRHQRRRVDSLADFLVQRPGAKRSCRPIEPLIRLPRPICSGACRPALRGIIMKQFFFAAALTFALAAGAVTVLTVQLTFAAAQTFSLGVGTLTGLTVKR
jgi:hypothetical protein